MDNNIPEELVSKYLKSFYEQRLQIIRGLNLRTILSHKNPYLFKATGLENPKEIVEDLLESFLSSSDETIFGNIFELIAKESARGNVGTGYGFDFSIETESKFSAYAMKSGSKWGNASQKIQIDEELKALKSRLRKLGKEYDPVIGHVYGTHKSQPNSKRVYRDVSGQAFWTEITQDPHYYLKLTRSMKQEHALNHKVEYEKTWYETVTKFTDEFKADFCKPDGSVDWDKLTKFVSEESREVRKEIQKKYRKPPIRKPKKENTTVKYIR